MSESQWDEAARKVVDGITPLILKWDDSKAIEAKKYIANLLWSEYADLCATYEKLVEYVNVIDRIDESTWPPEWEEFKRRKNELREDPLVRAAIERSNGNV